MLYSVSSQGGVYLSHDSWKHDVFGGVEAEQI